MLKGNEVAASQLRGRVTRAVEKLRIWIGRASFFSTRIGASRPIASISSWRPCSFLLFFYSATLSRRSTDSLLESYPSLLLARQNFLHGSLGLWNPYVFSGMPRAAEAVPALFYPEHWILFVVPLRYLFSTITFFALHQSLACGRCRLPLLLCGALAAPLGSIRVDRIPA